MRRTLSMLLAVAAFGACGEAEPPTPMEPEVQSELDPPEEEEAPAEAVARSDVPTVGTFGGEDCTLGESVSVGRHGFHSHRIVSVGEGRVLALWTTVRNGGVHAQPFDADGQALGEQVESGLPPHNSIGDTQRVFTRAARHGDRVVVMSMFRSDRHYHLQAAALDADGRPGPLGDDVDVGRGAEGAMAIASAGAALWVAFGTLPTPVRYERWTVAEDGAITRGEATELESGLPERFVVDGEHRALVYRGTHNGRTVQIDDGPGVQIAGDGRMVVTLDGARAHIVSENEGEFSEATVEAPWPTEPVTLTPFEPQADARLPLETPIELRYVNGEIERRNALTGYPVARAIHVRDQSEGETRYRDRFHRDVDDYFEWMGDHALLFTSGLQSVRCE